MQDVAHLSGYVDEQPPPADGVKTPWHRLRSGLEGRPFLRNVLIMLTGATGGQLASLLAAPILTRLYSPEQFGVLSVYLAVLTILVVIASLRYELTIPLAETESDAMNLAAVCGCVLVLTTSAVGLLAYLIPLSAIQDVWPALAASDDVLAYRALLPIGFFFLGAYYIALYLSTRDGAFRPIAISRLAQGVAGPLSQIALAFAQIGAAGLLIGSILGQSAGTFGLLWRQTRSRGDVLRTVTWRRMAALARRYIRFPLVASWTALLDTAGGNHLLYLLVATQYSPQIAGFIFLVERVVGRPLVLVGTSILQVFVGEAGRTVTADPEKLHSRFHQIIKHQFLFAATWIVLANAASVAFFALVFGEAWSGAVIYLHAISLAYLAQAVVQPVFHTLQILERQFLAAAWQISRLVLTLAVFGFGLMYGIEAPWVVAGYSVVQAACCAALLLMMSSCIRRLKKESEA